MKKIFKITVITAFVMSFIICFLKNPICYENDYWEEVGLQNAHLYNSIVTDRGEPLSIVKTNNEAIAIYEDVQFVWHNREMNGAFIRVEIISSKISLGRKKVCIGTKKTEIQNIYDSVFIEQIKDLQNGELGYLDGGVYIVFEFNNDDRVKKILISDYI